MMEDRILNEVLLSMIVDLPCILKSLLWVEGGKDLGGGGRGKKRRGSGRKHKIQPPQGRLGFLGPLLNSVWKRRGPQSWGRFSFGLSGGGRPKEQSVSLRPGKLSVLLRP